MLLSLLLATSSADEVHADNWIVVSPPSPALLIWTAVAIWIWVGVAFALSRLARRNGQSVWLIFVLSVVGTPLLAALLLVVLPRRAPA